MKKTDIGHYKTYEGIDGWEVTIFTHKVLTEGASWTLYGDFLFINKELDEWINWDDECFDNEYPQYRDLFKKMVFEYENDALKLIEEYEEELKFKNN